MRLSLDNIEGTGRNQVGGVERKPGESWIFLGVESLHCEAFDIAVITFHYWVQEVLLNGRPLPEFGSHRYFIFQSSARLSFARSMQSCVMAAILHINIGGSYVIKLPIKDIIAIGLKLKIVLELDVQFRRTRFNFLENMGTVVDLIGEKGDAQIGASERSSDRNLTNR